MGKELTFAPVLDMVVLKREEAAKESALGLDLPTSAQEKPLRGTVVAIGNKISENSPVKMGRTMIYKKFGGTEATIDGIDYIIIKETDLLLGL